MKAAALLIAVILGVGAVARAAPPEPPIPTPPELNQLYDGYDLRIPYQLWRYWIEGQKGGVTEALLTQPDAAPGDNPIGAPLLRYSGAGDMGLFTHGDLRAYCPPTQPYGFDQAKCHWVLRAARVRLQAGYSDNPLTAWMRQNFAPAKLAAHLKAEGLPPDSDWWMVDRKRLFANHPSAAEVLRGAAEVKRLASRDCPALAKAIQDMETRRIALPVNFWTVGPPTQLVPPTPHSASWWYRLNLLVDGKSAQVEGSGQWMTDIVGPVFDAARSCGMRL